MNKSHDKQMVTDFDAPLLKKELLKCIDQSVRLGDLIDPLSQDARRLIYACASNVRATKDRIYLSLHGEPLAKIDIFCLAAGVRDLGLELVVETCCGPMGE